MEIKINNTNAAQSCIDQNKILWELWIKDNLKKLIFPLVFSLLLIGIGMLDYENYDKIIVEDQSYLHNSHFPLFMGIAFLITILFSVIRIVKHRAAFFEKVDKIAHNHSLNSNTVVIELNECLVKYQSYELVQEMKWSMFSNYKIYKNYLILATNNGILSGIMINENLISEAQYSDLMSFVKTKLTVKK